MPAYGKNSRGGRRGSAASSSSSSYISTITMAIFVGLCLLGVYKLTSSTSTVNHPPHHHLQHNAVSSNQSPPRSVLRDPSSDALEDTQGELPEDAVKGEEMSQEKVRSQSVGTEEDVVEAAAMVQPQERPQEEEEVETNRVSEEIKQQQDQNQEKGQINAEQQQQMSEGELGENHEGTLQIIEQVTSGNHDGKSEEGGAKDIDNQPLSGQIPKSEEGEDNGITSQSQIEHDTDGTTENQQQQQQDEQQQQPQQQEEEQQQQQQQEQQQEEEQQQQEQEQQAEGEKNQQVEENPNPSEAIPDGSQVAVPDESNGDKKTWEMQADQSSNEKERRNENETLQANGGGEGEGDSGKLSDQGWELCNVTAGTDYIPCLDNEKAIKQLQSFRHYEHRERHCPEESPTCLVPLPNGYKQPIEWPQSRDRIWYNNVPHTKLVQVKGHQNWVKVAGEYLTFPGGGTQFIHGALHYIDFIQESVPEIAWGKRTRVILDVGCGVASFGGYLFERDVLAMSFAPKDEHEAQVQFALERGIPAISAVMGSQRLPFPSRVFDIVHCARCRVPWHANDGALLLELNRVLRPGGYFVWSATPVYQKLKEDVEIWEAMTALTKSMCWELHTIKQDKLNSVGAAMFRKPTSNECYEKRKQQNPPMCKEDDDPNAAWYIPLQSCMHRVPVNPSERGSQWPQEWPTRVKSPPYWLNNSQIGIYGKPAPDDFTADYEHWKRVVNKSYLTGFGINWSKVRNVMDMRAVYGGFAAALRDMKVWVMNLVNIDSQDTLPIIYERGLFGMYHDWCESFSTYPRTYDLLHADHLFSQLSKRCKILPAIVEVDRIVRPGGKLIVRDDSDAVSEVENLLKSLHWEIRLTFSKNNMGILCAEKSEWRPDKFSASA